MKFKRNRLEKLVETRKMSGGKKATTMSSASNFCIQAGKCATKSSKIYFTKPKGEGLKFQLNTFYVTIF